MLTKLEHGEHGGLRMLLHLERGALSAAPAWDACNM
jgi:hypothetical protein